MICQKYTGRSNDAGLVVEVCLGVHDSQLSQILEQLEAGTNLIHDFGNLTVDKVATAFPRSVHHSSTSQRCEVLMSVVKRLSYNADVRDICMYIALLIYVLLIPIFVSVLTCISLVVEVVFQRCSHDMEWK